MNSKAPTPTLSPYIGLFAAVILISLIACPATFGAARFSGTIVSIDSSGGTLVLQLGDGSKKTIQMQKNSRYMKGGGGSLGSFKTGEQVVATIVGPLNDDPLLADSLMDSFTAKQTAPANYTIPSNTRVGGYASTGGPSATGGTSPNVLANIAQGGGGNFCPPNVINAPGTESPFNLPPPQMGPGFTNPAGSPPPGQNPAVPQGLNSGPMMNSNQGAFTASPMVGNSPYAGQVITNPAGGPPQPMQNNQGGVNMMMAPQGTMPAVPTARNNPWAGQAQAGAGNQSWNGPQQANPAAIMTGQQNFQAGPASMINDQPSSKHTDPYGGNNPAGMMGDQQDNEEESDPFLGSENDQQAGGMPAPCQINGRIMDINLTNNVIFYMQLGSQDLGSAVVTPRTHFIDGMTKQPLNLRSLPKGGIIVVNGFQRGGSCIEATSIMLMKKN
jgi:hypothetical protein